MKKLLLLIFMAASFGLNAQIDAISKYFDKYMDDQDFTVVYVSPKMFSLVSKLDIEDMDEEAKMLLKEIKGLRILTTDKDPMKYYNEAMKTFDVSEYESLMTVRDEGENVNILIKSSSEDTIEELLLLVGGDEFVMLSFLGNIDIDRISKLAEGMDVKGAQHLEKLNKE
ncbi:MAG: DUF4252 domain-containing protein [Saprospiraceae bacterium]|nr:DUF4252 domain-containing protein [Saprospiraceae bacterium]